MSTLQAALTLATKGCRVFPIIGKKPGITRWQWQATTDSDKIRSWWLQPRFRDASVGIHPLGLLVLDIDGPLGEANL